LRGSGEEVHALTHLDCFAGARSAGVHVLQAEAQHLIHLFLLHRLGKIVLRTEPHGLCHFAGVTHARQHDHFGRGTGFADPLEGLQSVCARHHHIEQHQVGIDALYLFHGLHAIGSSGYPIRFQLQHSLEILQHAWLVVHHKDVASAHYSSATRLGEGFSKTKNENLLPDPGSLSTQILPPVACTRRRAMASPRPYPSARVPSGVRRKYSSKISCWNSGAIPGPVSETDMRQQFGAFTRWRRRSTAAGRWIVRRSQKDGSICSHTVPEAGVYFMALSSRLETTCCTL